MAEPWSILVVDDEQDVHDVTNLALKRRVWRGREFHLQHAHSAQQARKILRKIGHRVHVAVVDVVMESDDAGLELCSYIRANCAATIRIILRTGQPGVAPEEQILETYDIDHYLAKSEATGARLFSLIRSCLKTFEDVTALEAANASLTITNAELMRKDYMQQRIVAELEASGERINQLVARLQGVDQLNAEELRRTVGALSGVTQSVESLLRPGDFRSQVQSALENKSVLILLSTGKALRLTKAALAGVDASTAVAETWEDGVKALRTGKIDLLFVDWENLGVLNEATKYNPNLRAVLLTTQALFEEHGKAILGLPISSAIVISNLSESTENIDALGIQELVITAGKLISEDIFGLEKYLAWGVRVHEVRLRHSDQRHQILRQLDDFGRDCQLRASLRQKLVTFADELLMNAIWDAPVDAAGKAKYNHRDRKIPIDLLPEEEVTLRYASDGNQLALSVSDNFGRLQRETAFAYLVRCFAKGEDQISEAEGGAGLGLYMSYLSMSTFVINCNKGKRTEVVGLLNLRMSPRDLAGRPRSFHYFLKR